MTDELLAAHRLIVQADLRPTVGSTFQPTGFPNLGAAEFTRPGQPPSVLVESVQSMTNHLERVLWDDARQRPIELIGALAWVEVQAPDGTHLTSSREEAHRLSGAYVREAAIDGMSGSDWLIERLGIAAKRPHDRQEIARAIFAMDPLCLVHGVFFSEKGFHGNPKVRRAMHAVIEAHDAAPAISGGVKRDDVAFEADKSTGRGSEAGYGFIPFARTEYTARSIVLSVAVDLDQIRGYGLSPEQTRVVESLAIYELVSVLDGPLRLRTACDLTTTQVEVETPVGARLPPLDEAESALADAIGELGSEGSGPVIAVWDK